MPSWRIFQRTYEQARTRVYEPAYRRLQALIAGPMKPVADVVRRIWTWTERIADGFDRHFGGLMAAAVSFYALLSVVPMLSVGVAVLGWIVGGSDEALGHVQSSLSAYVPTSSKLIFETLSQIKRDRGIVGLIGLGGLVVSGSAIFTNLEQAFNYIWGVERMRGWVRQRVVAIATTLLTLALLMVSIGLTSALTWIENTSVPGVDIHPRQFPLVWAVAGHLATLALSTLMFALLYKIIPNKKIQWREAVVGAAFSGVAWELAKYLFALYLAHFGNYNKVYGSLGGLVILVMWTYYSCTILFIGAEIAADCGTKLPAADRPPGLAPAKLPTE